MTNFNTATRSFDLCAEGTQSYAWAWEGLDRVQCLSEIEHTNNDIVAYAHGWACELCHNCIAQIDPEGERGFTAEEITNDLIDDRHSLARALEAWLGDNDDSDDDNEEGEETSDEAYLGESTLAKIRRQKELLLEDRQDVPQIGGEQDGFEVVYGGWVNGAGGLDNPRVVVFSDKESFEKQNPHWSELLEDAKHRQCSPFTNLGDVYLYDRPEGGYEIYPREGIAREDGSVAEIW